MIIYFLRHASAGERKKSTKKDERRPLDAQGIEQCGDVGRALAALDVAVDALISSPLKRATQTAALVGNEIGYERQLFIEKALRPEATFEQFREMLRKYSRADAVMVVGHNPNFSEFLGKTVSPRNSIAHIDLKKGSVARVESNGKTAVLQWCFTPRLIRAIIESSHAMAAAENGLPAPQRASTSKATRVVAAKKNRRSIAKKK
ncbi:MAG TPA: histidine phosphatase family protein [Terriglobales bacterium]